VINAGSKAGFDYAKEEYEKGKSIETLEAEADGAFDFTDFDRGILDFIRSLEVEKL